MTLDASPMIETDDRRYMLARVVDALLREDVQGITRQARVLEEAPVALSRLETPPLSPGPWLEIPALASGTLWLPVTPERFMQSWRYRHAPVVVVDAPDERPRELKDAASLIAWLGEGLEAEARDYYAAFADECRLAEQHRLACREARDDYFGRCAIAPLPTEWSARFAHYDRLAAFQDHPFYPTARAKLGFDVTALRRFAPEFQPRFMLRWLAVPEALFHASVTTLPEWWPSPERVGLDARLARDHRLLPVHPFLWASGLDAMLEEAGLAEGVIKAPLAAVEVQPTLSVRSLMLTERPETHIKLPLTIRTLGSRNIRTIKPSTIGDGHRVQCLLGAIAEQDARLAGRLLLTDEHQGAHVAGQSFLGFILRRYPSAVEDATLVSVAGLVAPSPGRANQREAAGGNGGVVYEELAERFFDGDVRAFLRAYLRLTFDIHLTLWLRYGVALESNQQNSMLLLRQGGEMRLLLKDNDAPRLQRDRLETRWPALYRLVEGLEDPRIWSESSRALEQMFVTITLQLNVAPLIEHLAARGHGERGELYGEVRRAMADSLAAMPEEDASPVTGLLERDFLDAKYLLTAGTLASKASTGASDINKFYGRTAPNFLKSAIGDQASPGAAPASANTRLEATP
ncbi:IucA/IucC family protein [Halomonas beimenensis]|uniref:Vibrioferrin amide bond forming protein PvsB n=1 Tax=Halomonas beimenensis TaxID=475662 RepID=A0A291P9W3_9GAMM|nr:IucA/IucC family protein [Halomonas beimenensis]ATJ83706.1 vibrioferrin amide bond forming protein PvsB [Halomonas beimenensis]